MDSSLPQIMEDGLPVVPQECAQNSTPEQIMDSPVPRFLEAVVEVTPQDCVQNRFSEQIMDSPVPQLMEAVVEVTPQERVQNRFSEQIVGVPVSPLMEAVVEVAPQERLLNRTQEQISGSPVPQIMEAVVEVFSQERVQSRLPEQIMDFPVEDVVGVVRATPQERVRFTWKVFTVRHHRGDQACAVDTLGFNIKGLDKFNLPRSGDVMVLALLIDVPVPQIAEDIVGWSVTRERIIERFWAVYLLGHLGSLSSSWDISEAPAKGLRGRGGGRGGGGGGGDLGFELIFDGYVAEIRCEGSRAWHPLDVSWVPLPVLRGRLNILGARGQGLGIP